MRKRSGQVHSRESSATLQLTVSLLYPPILNLLQNLQGWFIIRLENRRILECPTVAQSETYKALSLLTDYRLSPIGVEDSLSVYLRLCLLSMYVKAANTTSKSVSTSKVFIPTSFLFPERTTARLSLLL